MDYTLTDFILPDDQHSGEGWKNLEFALKALPPEFIREHGGKWVGFDRVGFARDCAGNVMADSDGMVLLARLEAKNRDGYRSFVMTQVPKPDTPYDS